MFVHHVADCVGISIVPAHEHECIIVLLMYGLSSHIEHCLHMHTLCMLWVPCMHSIQVKCYLLIMVWAWSIWLLISTLVKLRHKSFQYTLSHFLFSESPLWHHVSRVLHEPTAHMNILIYGDCIDASKLQLISSRHILYLRSSVLYSTVGCFNPETGH